MCPTTPNQSCLLRMHTFQKVNDRYASRAFTDNATSYSMTHTSSPTGPHRCAWHPNPPETAQLELCDARVSVERAPSDSRDVLRWCHLLLHRIGRPRFGQISSSREHALEVQDCFNGIPSMQRLTLDCINRTMQPHATQLGTCYRSTHNLMTDLT